MFCIFVNDMKDGLTQPELECRLQNVHQVCSKIGVKRHRYENLRKRALAHFKGFSWHKVADETMKIPRTTQGGLREKVE
jgi:hypothetical protein